MIIENIVVIFFIDHLQQSTREHEALVMIQEKERIQEESLHALSLAYESQRKSTHDFRKHISTISTLISKNQNPSFHGFGIRNIKDILHKYNAEYIMTYDSQFNYLPFLIIN